MRKQLAETKHAKLLLKLISLMVIQCLAMFSNNKITEGLLIPVLGANFVLLFFSSPEPKAPGELIGLEGSVVRRPSVVRPSTISNDFSSETIGPIATKFHIQPPGPLGKKNYSNGPGHMTNMAAMPIYGKNLKKIFSRTTRPMTLKLSM